MKLYKRNQCLWKWTFDVFAELKTRRAQQRAARPVVQPNNKMPDTMRKLDQSRTADAPVLVDSPDEFEVDRPQQLQPEVPAETTSTPPYLPARIEIRWEESKGRGIWSCDAKSPGECCLLRTKFDSLNFIRSSVTHWNPNYCLFVNALFAHSLLGMFFGVGG